jgi:site-specific DNA-cytosine methylase
MNKDKIILDLCGGTGSWSKPYRDNGYTVITITLPNYNVCSTVKYPDQIDFLSLEGEDISVKLDNVYGIIAAPPCTMFSFARTNAKKPRDLREGMETVHACLDIIWACQYRLKNQYAQKPTLKFWALENPNGHLKFFLGHPAFSFDPYEFGDMYSKKTHLWGWFDKPLKTHGKEARILKNKFDKLSMQEIKSIGDNIFRDKSTRQELRSITPQGFAQAFFKANQ